MRSADAFRQSDPDLNRQFRRLWTEPARARRITAPVPVPATFDSTAVEIVADWRANRGRA